MIETIVTMFQMHPIVSSVLCAGALWCVILWLFLALAVHAKIQQNGSTSMLRRLLPAGMVIVPCTLLMLCSWLIASSAESKPVAALDAPRYNGEVLCRLDAERNPIPVEDGKYALYRKFADGVSVSFGIVIATPDGFHTFPLDASGIVLNAPQPQDAYSMVAYGIHSLPAFEGEVLSSEPLGGWKDFTSIHEPYVDSEIAEQAFPFSYVDVHEGKGVIRTGYLTKENAGGCLLLYGTWAEPIVTSLVLRGFSREYIAEVISLAFPHAFLNGSIPVPAVPANPTNQTVQQAAAAPESPGDPPKE